MNKLIFRKIQLSFVMFFVWVVAFSQPAVRFLPDSSNLIIKGTSNLHEWEEKVGTFNVNLTLKYSNKQITGIDKVLFSCNSSSVVSENSTMTGKSKDALKTDQYPKIVFTLSGVDYFLNNDGKLSGSINGDLILAGVTKKINLTFSGTVAPNKLKLKGSKKIKMTDFNISPPTALLGTLKTGDTIELFYSLQFKIE